MIYIKYNVVIHVGNMWAQNWENIYSIVQPFKGKPEIEVTHELKAQVTLTKISTVISMILYCIKQQDQHCPLGFYSFLFFFATLALQHNVNISDCRGFLYQSWVGSFAGQFLGEVNAIQTDRWTGGHLPPICLGPGQQQRFQVTLISFSDSVHL